MNRREFIALLGGAVVSWPLVARAQQSERLRRIGVLMGLAKNDPVTMHTAQILRQALQALGWTDGKNVELAYRYAAGDPGRARAFSDPVVGGIVASFARPGANMTGFTNYEFAMGAKWLEILKEIAPTTRRISLMLTPETGAYYTEYLRSIEAVALSFAVQATLAPIRNANEIEGIIAALVREPGGGLIVLPSSSITAHRQQIIALAARYRLPVVYPFPVYAIEGGLVSYGIDLDDLFRRTASYVDRVLKGEKPSDLPVQAPTKFQLVINLKTAKALGLDVPPTLIARADEVIE
jgi:putative tryptophan/tyrosine transport system substrate-binding protein